MTAAYPSAAAALHSQGGDSTMFRSAVVTHPPTDGRLCLSVRLPSRHALAVSRHRARSATTRDIQYMTPRSSAHDVQHPVRMQTSASDTAVLPKSCARPWPTLSGLTRASALRLDRARHTSTLTLPVQCT